MPRCGAGGDGDDTISRNDGVRLVTGGDGADVNQRHRL